MIYDVKLHTKSCNGQINAFYIATSKKQNNNLHQENHEIMYTMVIALLQFSQAMLSVYIKITLSEHRCVSTYFSLQETKADQDMKMKENMSNMHNLSIVSD